MKRTHFYGELITIGVLAATQFTFAAPTSTVIQNLFITGIKPANGTSTLVINNAGFVTTSTPISAAGGITSSTPLTAWRYVVGDGVGIAVTSSIPAITFNVSSTNLTTTGVTATGTVIVGLQSNPTFGNLTVTNVSSTNITASGYIQAATLSISGVALSPLIISGTATSTIAGNGLITTIGGPLNASSTITQGGVAVVTTARTITIAGTANQITSSAGAQDLSANRTWTLSLPQNIDTSANVTFAHLSANVSSTNQDLAGYLTVSGQSTFASVSSTNITASGYGTFPTLNFTNASGTNATLSGYLTVATTSSFGSDVIFPGTGIWKSTGNVGIGTTGPGTLLQVTAGTDGNTAVTFGSGGSAPTANRTNTLILNTPHSGTFVGQNTIRLQRAGTSLWDIGNDSDASTGAKSANTDLAFYSYGNSSYNFALKQAGGAVFMNGNVGIGTTSPNAKLDITGANGSAPTDNITPQLTLESSATAGVGVGPVLSFRGQTGNGTANYSFAAIQGVKGSAVAGNYSGDLTFFTQNSGGGTALTEQMRITSGGNVGIGNTAPTSTLSVTGSSTVTGQATFLGNVGIGTTAPVALLEVAGRVSSTEVVTPSSTIVTSLAIPQNTTISKAGQVGINNTTGTFKFYNGFEDAISPTSTMPGWVIENPTTSEDDAFWIAPFNGTLTGVSGVNKNPGDTLAFNIQWGQSRASTTAQGAKSAFITNQTLTATTSSVAVSVNGSSTFITGDVFRFITSAASSSQFTMSVYYHVRP